jgi:hypothetical protein
VVADSADRQAAGRRQVCRAKRVVEEAHRRPRRATALLAVIKRRQRGAKIVDGRAPYSGCRYPSSWPRSAEPP